MGPVVVALTADRWPLSQGRAYTLTCTSRGSLPPASLSWWLDGARLPDPAPAPDTTETNLTSSVLRRTGRAHDHGRNLTCRARNVDMGNSRFAYKEETLQLDVQCESSPCNYQISIEFYQTCKLLENVIQFLTAQY